MTTLSAPARMSLLTVSSEPALATMSSFGLSTRADSVRKMLPASDPSAATRPFALRDARNVQDLVGGGVTAHRQEPIGLRASARCPRSLSTTTNGALCAAKWRATASPTRP